MLRPLRALPGLALVLLLVACSQGGATAVAVGRVANQASAAPAASGSASNIPAGATTGGIPGGSTIPSAGATTVTAPSGKGPALALVANFDDDTIGVYSVATNGAQKPVPGSPFRTGPRPSSIALSPDNRFVYVSTAGRDGAAGGSVWAYALASNGTLTDLRDTRHPAGETPGPLALDPAGRRLYVASSGAGEGIYVFALDAASGTLRAVTGSPFTLEGDRATKLTFAPDGRFLYAAHDDGRGISGYRVDAGSGATTALKLADSVSIGNAFSIAINPAGTLLYAGFESGIFGYRLESDGTLTPLSGQPLVKGTHRALLFHPSAPLLYAADYYEYILTAYTLDNTGRLRANPGALATTSYPVALALGHSATFLYASTEENLMHGVKLDGNGATLTALPGDPTTTGSHPATIVITGGLPTAP